VGISTVWKKASHFPTKKIVFHSEYKEACFIWNTENSLKKNLLYPFYNTQRKFSPGKKEKHIREKKNYLY